MVELSKTADLGKDYRIDASVLQEGFLRSLFGYALFNSARELMFCSSSLISAFPQFAGQFKVGMSHDAFLGLLENTGGLSSITNAADPVFRLQLPDQRCLELCSAQLSCEQTLVTAIDKTEKYSRHDALSQSEARFRSFANLATDWFWELDKNLCYQYHSGHRSSNTGIRNEVLVGQFRISTMEGKVIEDDQFKLHNRLLRERQSVDVVLSWRNQHDQFSYSRILAEPKFDSGDQFAGYIGCGIDVSHFKQLSLQLEYLAMHDDLTLLMNRRCFDRHLTGLLTEKSYKENPISLCFVDLDHFKMVNDDGGHSAGDALLRELADLFREVCGIDSVIARLGGDEFAVIVNLDEQAASLLMQSLIERVARHELLWNNGKFRVGASVGIIEIDGSCEISSDILSKVDIACYHAKRSGRNQVQLYDPENSQQNAQKREQELASRLRTALEEGSLALYLQPIIPCADTNQTNQPIHRFEALLRIQDYRGDYHSCGDLIPAAEKFGLMHQIDQWVLGEVLQALKVVNDIPGSVSVSVNLSGNSLSNPDYLEKFVAQVFNSRIDPALLCFEITETSAILNIDGVIDFINRMKVLGCRFALDDFGSGFSSFSYLKALPIDYLKLDGSFVRDIKSDKGNFAIVSAFNQLSHDLGIETVAEFVEDLETQQLLTHMGIDYLQGYGVGMPAEMYSVLASLDIPLSKAG